MLARVIVLMIAVAGVLGGCATAPSGSTRVFDASQYKRLFDATQDALSQYSFSVVEADAQTGTILARPLYADNESQGLLQSLPTRRVASAQIIQGRGTVSVRLTIEVQHLVTQASQSTNTGLTETYSGVPHDTPADGGAATTAQQNTAWRRVRFDRQMEMAMLDDISRAMGLPTEPTSQPASRPAK